MDVSIGHHLAVKATAHNDTDDPDRSRSGPDTASRSTFMKHTAATARAARARRTICLLYTSDAADDIALV